MGIDLVEDWNLRDAGPPRASRPASKAWVIPGEVALMLASYFLAALCWYINAHANRRESSDRERLARRIEMLSDRAI